MPDLHRMPARVLQIRRPHLFGIRHIERHHFFLIHVLARVERGGKLRGVQVRRRGDYHRVDRGIVQKLSIIGMKFRVRSERPRLLQLLRKNIAHRAGFRVRAGSNLLKQFPRPIAESYKSDPNAFIGAENPRRNRRDAGNSSRNFSKEVPAGVHIRLYESQPQRSNADVLSHGV